MTGRDAGQHRGVRRGVVRQRIALEVSPEDLNGVEFGCIRGQQRDIPARVVEVVGDDLGAMTGQAIPHEDKPAPQMTRERPEKREQHAVVTFSLARSEKYNPGCWRRGDSVKAAMMDTFWRARPR